ncbi:MAG: 2-amino-4-hydroxy-6-hydroxymethyldihydropteridine diphosphokinase [Rhodoferax sp.]|uniref:2-amino-4-hydroxy-6- hydroxymethyldihydropteridine diphosphokinase n=1 Tax=Rhodoferax sp. TaxID=50421 RepID=UPI0013FE631A|nr:2-amino-4-hydroxy-6-hydroxymethyldihydropteridine diphosphokinase [Rhodoferax sp.]NDP40401.1 2-amino-4-hydroxy-6-hydroxymethyldihydropteridine diphosphokinase [Rhodoferax sp.]
MALGANLGDPQATILKAMNDLALTEGVSLIKCSSLYRTAPVDSSGPDYVNAVVEVRTVLTAPALLAQLQALEQTGGRQRPFRNAPRTLDLDLLTFGEARIQSEPLTIPHPRMGARAFVLVPLAEIAPQVVTAAQLQAVRTQHISRLGKRLGAAGKR